MTARKSSAGGFTLIEVLVSVALMALIATILVASVALGGHAWQRVTRLTANSEDIAQAQDFLRERLSTAYPQTYDPERLGTSTLIASDGTSLEFTGFAPAAQAGALLQYQVALRGDRGTLTIRTRRAAQGVSQRTASDWSDEALVRDVASLAIQFWQESLGSSGRWVNSWNDAKELPRGIRIDVSFAPGDPRQWPTLYLEPRVDTPVDCQFDVVSRRCRGTT